MCNEKRCVTYDVLTQLLPCIVQGDKISPAPSLLPDREGMPTPERRDVLKAPHSPYASPADDGGTLARNTSFKRHPAASGSSEGCYPMATPRPSCGV